MTMPYFSFRYFLFAGMLGVTAALGAQPDTLSNPTLCGMALPITDNNCPEEGPFFQPNEFLIEVADAPSGILGLDVYLREVRLIISHQWVSDLDIRLISPGGVSVDLSLDNGGSDEHYGDPADTTCAAFAALATDACAPIAEAEAPFTAEPYAPEQSFFLFNDSLTAANGLWTLQICDDVALDTGRLRFVHLLFEPISCLPLEEVVVADVDSTTVSLDWTVLGDCETAVVEYGPPGFTPGTELVPGPGGALVFADCPPFQLTGLAENAEYDIYVRKYCNLSGSFSANACPVSVATGCAPPPRTVVTTFDTLDQCPVLNCGAACTFGGVWQNEAALDDLDWFINQGMTPTSGTGPNADVGGAGKYAYLETTGSACNNGAAAWLRSNCLQLDKQGTDSCHVSFNYYMFGLNVGTLRLEVSNDGGFSWSPLWVRSGNQGARWRKAYLSLSDYADGEVLQFRFVAIGGNGSKGDIALDNIVFHGSLDLGPSSVIYYQDADGDGYGRPDVTLASCAGTAPPGFADNPDDCNDENAEINPGQPEILCDRIDNNCNGLDPDDGQLPAPVTTHDTICSGQTATICATPGYGGTIFWYGSPDSLDFVGVGNCLTFTYANDAPEPDIYSFYAEEIAPFCASQLRSEASIVVFPNPDPATAQEPAICPGQPFNLASLNITDANFTGGLLTFHEASPALPENQLADPVVAPAAPTEYFYLMTSPQGCSGENSVLVDINPGPDLVFQPADSLSLCRENEAMVTVTAQGGASPYTYLWDTGDQTEAAVVEAAFAPGGTKGYGVTVTDAEGCFSVDTLLVTTTTSIDSVRRFVSPVDTCMGSNGSITLIPLNGQPPFDYVWSGTSGQSGNANGVADTLMIDGLQQGAYRITITDSSEEQCAFVMRQVVVNGPDVIVEGVDIEPVTCAGAADGQICLNVSSLTGADPSFFWEDGQNGPCADSLAGGVYAVTIEGGMCTSIIDNLVVEEPDSLTVVADLTDPSCAAAADGSIALTIFDGTPGYSVSWNGAPGGTANDGLAEGSYIAEITDANGCVLTDTFALDAPPPLAVVLDSLREPSCFEYNDGLVLASGQGGTPPYQYEWNTGVTAPALTQASAGNYSLTITDFNGCSASLAFAIGQPGPLSLEVLDLENPTCVGERTGEVRVGASGGAAPYAYLWSTGLPDSLLTAVEVGTYQVTVSDANDCPVDSLSVTLTAETSFELDVELIAPDCEGPHTGSIAISPEGVEPFLFEWSTGSADSTIQFLKADSTYRVTITDGRECVYDTAFQILAPQVFAANYFVQDPSCFGIPDGLIDVNLTAAGTPPFAYRWSDGVTMLDRFGLPASSLQLTIVDSDSCVFESPVIELAEPDPLTVQLDARSDILCAGETSGFIEITPQGGTPPYAIDWVGVADDTEDLYNLGAGEYRLQLSDANGCPVDTTFLIAEPEPLEAEVTVELNDPCAVSLFNRLIPEVTGGTPPYAFFWSDGSTDSLLVDVPSGDYELLVSDANGCEDLVTSIKVRDYIPPIQLDTFFVDPVTCNGFSDGSMTAAISGGAGPYFFFFSNTDTFQTFNNTVTVDALPPGNYSVTVTDLSSLCTIESVTIASPNPPILVHRRDSVHQIACEPGAIFSTTLGGVPPYTFAWYDSSGQQVSNLSDLVTSQPGQYLGVATDALGCIDSLPATTLETVGGEAIVLDSVEVAPVLCRGDSTGYIDLVVGGGVQPLDFTWSNGSTEEDPAGLPAGLYTVTVTDSVGCAVVFGSFAVTEPEAEIEVSTFVDSVSCFGFDDGAIEVEVNGGVTPYQYIWRWQGQVISTGQPRVDDLAAGVYQLEVADDTGCTQLYELMVLEPGPLEVVLSLEEDLATAATFGGTPPYTYLWNTGSEGSTTELSSEGWYVCTVTDNNLCQRADSILVTNTQEAGLLTAVKMFPNPGKDELTLLIEGRIGSGPLSCRLFDLLGRPLWSRRLPGTGQYELSAVALPAGTYFLQLQYEGRTVYAGRWVKVE